MGSHIHCFIYYTKNTLDDERTTGTVYNVVVEAREPEPLEVRCPGGRVVRLEDVELGHHEVLAAAEAEGRAAPEQVVQRGLLLRARAVRDQSRSLRFQAAAGDARSVRGVAQRMVPPFRAAAVVEPEVQEVPRGRHVADVELVRSQSMPSAMRGARHRDVDPAFVVY